MRINKFVAQTTGMSRRKADEAIKEGRVAINGQKAVLGDEALPKDAVELDGNELAPPGEKTIIKLNKPAGYVCSRDGQGSKTIYELLPEKYHNLKTIGRLDKDSSGLLLLTNDGTLAHQLTHPSFNKVKIYEVQLNKKLSAGNLMKIRQGIDLEDGPSYLEVEEINENDNLYKITMTEGRNRQIRRTFSILGYEVVTLRRTSFGPHSLNGLKSSGYKQIQ